MKHESETALNRLIFWAIFLPISFMFSVTIAVESLSWSLPYAMFFVPAAIWSCGSPILLIKFCQELGKK